MNWMSVKVIRTKLVKEEEKKRPEIENIKD